MFKTLRKINRNCFLIINTTAVLFTLFNVCLKLISKRLEHTKIKRKNVKHIGIIESFNALVVLRLKLSNTSVFKHISNYV